MDAIKPYGAAYWNFRKSFKFLFYPSQEIMVWGEEQPKTREKAIDT